MGRQPTGLGLHSCDRFQKQDSRDTFPGQLLTHKIVSSTKLANKQQILALSINGLALFNPVLYCTACPTDFFIEHIGQGPNTM